MARNKAHGEGGWFEVLGVPRGRLAILQRLLKSIK